jgi:hypothetical protein
MRTIAAVGATLAAVVAIGTASASGISLTTGPTLPDCGAQELAPWGMALACGDGNYGLSALKWNDWGAASATATGSASANDCVPNCAAGTFHSYPVTATASAVSTCRSGRKQYTRLVLRYPGLRPKGIGATDVWKFPCDATGPGPTITAKPVAKNQLMLTGVGWQTEKGDGCTPSVTLSFSDKTKPFASAKIGANDSFRLAVIDVRAGSIIVARQRCSTPAQGASLNESAIVIKS